MLQISYAESCKYHATWKGLYNSIYIYISSKCRRCHAKRDVLPSQCRLTWQNAENMKILKIPRKQRVSIWLPLWVYECAIWAFHCTIMALSSLNSVVCFSVFLALVVSPVFFLLGFAKLYTGFLTSPVHLFIATKATIVRKSQTQPTPKQRPQHKQLLIDVDSVFLQATGTPPPTTTSNSNNNKKKLLLQLQL